MILLWLILIPLVGGVLAGSPARKHAWPRWLSLVCSGDRSRADPGALGGARRRCDHAATGTWLAEIDWPWIPQLGIRFHLGLDGLSLLLVLLTVFLGIMSVLASWTEITERVGFFHFNLMLTWPASSASSSRSICSSSTSSGS